MTARPASAPGLASLPPDAAEGWALVRRAIDSDGALGGALKALFVAAAACVRGDDEMAERELGRGFARGLEPAEAWRAAAALLLARGEPAHRRLVRALASTAPEAAAAGPDPAPAPGPDDADAYFRRHFGTIPPRQALLAARAPTVYEGYFRLHRRVLGTAGERAKVAELLMLTVNAADYQTAFVAIHMEGARRAGASEEELIEAVICAIPAAGIAAWPIAAQALTGEI